MKNDRWIQRWNVPGSNGHTWIVAKDREGNYGCSCPVWKFKRIECHHILAIKNNPQSAGQIKYRDAQPGNVGEVTIKKDVVLYPLVPLGGNIATHLAATIVYDLQRANVRPEQVADYKNRMLGKSSFKAVTDYVVERGRLIYTQFQKGRGWINPVATHYDTPLRTI